MAKKKGVSSLAFLIGENTPKSSDDVEEMLQGGYIKDKEVDTEQPEVEIQEQITHKTDADKEEQLPENIKENNTRGASKNETREVKDNSRRPIEYFLERPGNFLKEKTENLAVNTSQRDMLKLLATIEGTQLNILVYNILDDFLNYYGVKELSNIIEKKKRRVK